MKRYIFGSGGFAKEVLCLLNDVYKKDAFFCGFIDISTQKKSVEIGSMDYPIISELEFKSTIKANINEIELFIGIASTDIINRISKEFSNFNFPNLIHESFIFDKNSVTIGRGNIITAGCIFTCCISIDSFNIFNTNVAIGHDCLIGSFNIFLPRTQISGAVQIGDSNFFGMNSSVIQGKKIGNLNRIGAHTFIINNVKDNTSLFGIPGTKQEY
jgi:sugar O-acyltransferase (sialic acid O-acetyltransferase NeuD family)